MGAQGANAGGSSASAPGGGSSQAGQGGSNAGSQAEINQAVAVAAAQTDPAPFEMDGLEFQIETPKGQVRTSTQLDDDGKPKWSVVMPAHYGEIVGTEGRDGDPVDAFIGPNPGGAKKIWIIDQINPKNGKFDEHKAMVGFNTQAEAIATYKAAFADGSGESRIGRIPAFKGDTHGKFAITEMGREEFADWVNEGMLPELNIFEQPQPNGVYIEPHPALSHDDLWAELQEINTAWHMPANTPFFEGMVRKN